MTFGQIYKPAGWGNQATGQLLTKLHRIWVSNKGSEITSFMLLPFYFSIFNAVPEQLVQYMLMCLNICRGVPGDSSEVVDAQVWCKLYPIHDLLINWYCPLKVDRCKCLLAEE
jgi:hypothetical protein